MRRLLSPLFPLVPRIRSINAMKLPTPLPPSPRRVDFPLRDLDTISPSSPSPPPLSNTEVDSRLLLCLLLLVSDQHLPLLPWKTPSPSPNHNSHLSPLLLLHQLTSLPLLHFHPHPHLHLLQSLLERSSNMALLLDSNSNIHPRTTSETRSGQPSITTTQIRLETPSSTTLSLCRTSFPSTLPSPE